MGRYLSRLSPLMVLEFTPEQQWSPKKAIECFIKVCPDPGNARDLQLAALCWGLAHAYQRVNNIIQHPQEEENASGSDPTLVTDAAANPTPATGPAAPAAPKTGATAEPVSSPILVSITPTFKKKQWMQKSAHLVREETPTKKGKEEETDKAGYSEAGTSREQEEEGAELINKAVTT